jgi:hypothetical protein
MASSIASVFNELCDVCKNTMQILRMEGNHVNLSHHTSISSLSNSADTACGICTVLLDHVESEYLRGRSPHEKVEMFKRLFPILCSSDTSCVAWQDSFELTLTSGGLDDLNIVYTLEVSQEDSGQSSYVSISSQLRLTPCADDDSHYTPASTTGSELALRLVISWLNQCMKKHDRCNAQRSEKWNPTRLLDVGSGEGAELRLINGHNALPAHPYATLSHCWGRVHVPKTTTGNYSGRCVRIQTDEMSNTFNHAIQITRLLGIRYLWIDSLCIVQDDHEDWVREAVLMSKVYRCGYINIAATGASNGLEGCHWERDPRTIFPTTVTIEWSSSQDTRSQRYHVVPDSEYWARKLMEEPLHNRGWIFQERILSPRVIHFGKSQLFWECRELVACETYSKGLPSSLRQNTFVDIKTLDLGDEPQDERWPAKYTSTTEELPTTLLQRIWRMLSQHLQPVTRLEATLYAPMRDTSVYQDWDTLVELYSLGALSYSQDKLVALSGIASVVLLEKRAGFHDGYLAGLWQSSLPLHLLWISEVHTRTGHQGPIAHPPISYYNRDGQYIAPSWSWASMDGKISFEWCRNNYNTRDYFTTVEGADVAWTNYDFRFGGVKAAKLIVTAPMAAVLWNPVSNPPGTAPMSGTITHIFPIAYDQQTAISAPPDIDSVAEIRFDTVLDNAPQSLVLLPIISTTKKLAHETDLALGLVLHQTKVAAQFRRLGVFHTTRSQINRIIRKLPRQTVTIL